MLDGGNMEVLKALKALLNVLLPLSDLDAIKEELKNALLIFKN